MSEICTIVFTDGRIRVIDPDRYVSAEPFGRSVMSEMTLHMENLARGMFIDVSHYERPDEEEATLADGSDLCPGVGYVLVNDCYIQALEPSDMDEVAQITFLGQRVALRVGGELVVLAKLQAATQVYLSEDYAEGVLANVASLADIAERECLQALEEGLGGWDEADAEEVDAMVASRLGVSVGLLNRARDYAASFDEGLGDGQRALSETDGVIP